MIDLLPVRTGLTLITLVLAVIIFIWSRKYPALFIGLWAFAVMTTRLGTQYYGWARMDWQWEITLTAGAVMIVVALAFLAHSIWEQKQT